MRGHTRTGLRIGAYVASGALALSGLVLAVTPAQAAPLNDPAPSNQAATWLLGQLRNHVVYNDQYSFDDIALSADIALALDEVGGHDTDVSAILDAIEPRAHDEWYTSSFNNVTTTYGGSIAKLLVLVQESAGTPTSFGGNNLVSLLEGQVASAAPIAGRVQNENDSFGDANTIGQAFAARGLATAGSAKASDALDFLLKQQCPAGGFRLSFTADKTASGQSCTDDSQSETDATAIALSELKAMNINSGAVGTAITNAVTWLGGQQKTDGSWGGGAGTEGSNANSTGLATTALGDFTHSSKGAQWLRDHQATSFDTCTRLATSRGAVAYDDTSLATARRDGITTTTRDQFRRGTAQAVAGLRYLLADDSPSTPNLVGATGYLKAGSRATLRTYGVHAGDQLCLTGRGVTAPGTSTGTSWSQTVTLPPGTATRTYTVRDRDGRADSASVKVLGRANLTVRSAAYRVKRSHTVRVTISHLAPSERASLYYRHHRVAFGQAGPGGRFVATIHVGRSLGKQGVVGFGQFGAFRDGRTVIKVVR